MQSRLLPQWIVLSLLLPALFLPMSRSSGADVGVLWLEIESENQYRNLRFQAPLDWMVTSGWDLDDMDVAVSGVPLDLAETWKEHQNLPIGEVREVEHGRTEDGEPYVVRVHSDAPAEKRAEGKVHILARDEEGEITDIRFPLNVPGFIKRFLAALPLIGDRVIDESVDLDSGLPPVEELERLGDYGPFVFLMVTEEQPKLRITIE